jgi:hypothetical protein
MSENKKRTRRWVFTLNNPTGEINEFIESLTKSVTTRYLVVGKEFAPTTGTLHWQGFVEFENAATFNQVKQRIEGAHIEPAKGSNSQNRDYCTKGNDFVEYGQLFTRVQTSEQASEVVRLIVSGMKPSDIAANYQALSAYVVNHYRALRDMYNDLHEVLGRY